jgi:hypothetical protein
MQQLRARIFASTVPTLHATRNNAAANEKREAIGNSIEPLIFAKDPVPH